MTMFCVAFTKLCQIRIHCRIEKLNTSFTLAWIWVSTAYSRFNNLQEMYWGDLCMKLTQGLVSLDSLSLPCDSHTNFKHNTKWICVYEGIFGKSVWFTKPCVSYKIYTIRAIHNNPSRNKWKDVMLMYRSSWKLVLCMLRVLNIVY